MNNLNVKLTERTITYTQYIHIYTTNVRRTKRLGFKQRIRTQICHQRHGVE